MEHLLSIETASEWHEAARCGQLSDFNPLNLERDRPDEHWLLAAAGGELLGHCSLWHRKVPGHPDHRLGQIGQMGLIGHYAARDDGRARRLLTHACARLAAHGCTLAVGPMNGSTWRQHRFISQRGTEPPFFLEPDHPDAWLRQFQNEGFTPLAEYTSALATDLQAVDMRVARAAWRLTQAGVTIRPLEAAEFEAELRCIYEIASVSFRRNFLYTPIAEAEFIGQYRAMQQYLRPDLALMAEREGRPAGFLFALPDWARARRGQSIDTIVIKTVAVLPGRELAGLGNVLVARCHAAAAALGYNRAIHALMHDANNSRNLSGRYAQPMRRYVLLAKRLV